MEIELIFFKLLLLGGADLVHRNEMTELLARKALYEKMKITNVKRLLKVKRLAKVHVPLCVVIFISGWWILGMNHYYNP